jgi:peptidoglycan/LPS O-acetylase OafA/YrhL
LPPAPVVPSEEAITRLTLADRARERDNSFDVLRLAAAALVLVSHSFVVVGGAEPRVGDWPLGTLGVEIFFAMSGFLVASSWLSQPRLRAFVVKRALRIVPALLLCVAVCAFVLGPLVTVFTPGGYFSASSTFTYPIDNLLAVVSGGTLHHIALDLPGVFATNAMSAVNLSLWTLPIEVQAYAMIALVGLVGLLRLGLPALAIGLFALSVTPAGVADAPVIGSGLEFLRGGQGESAHLLALFAVSALLYVHRARIVLRTDLAALALALFLLSLGTSLERVALLLTIPYLVLFLAYRSWPGLRRLTRHADVSYGLYLAAFPVQQTIVHAWGGGTPSALVVIAIALPVTYVLALGSWYLVEKRALRLKGVLATRRRPRPIPTKAAEPSPAPVRS